MEWTKKIFNQSGSLLILIPAELAAYLDLKAEDLVTMKDDSGKHGKFISFWKAKDQQVKKK